MSVLSPEMPREYHHVFLLSFAQCQSWQLLMAESYGKRLWDTTYKPGLESEGLKYSDKLDPGSFLWQQHLFLPLLFPLSVLQWPARPCWQELSTAQLQAGMLLLVRFSLLSLQAVHGNLHWQWHSALGNINSWRSIQGSNVCNDLSKAWKSSWALLSLSDWKLLVKQRAGKPEFWAVVCHNQSFLEKYSLKKELPSGEQVVYRMNSMLRLIFIATMNLLKENSF